MSRLKDAELGRWKEMQEHEEEEEENTAVPDP